MITEREWLYACRLAEGTLTEKERITYLMKLSQPIPSAMPIDPNYADEQWLLVHAPEVQRLPAFIKTVCPEKWKTTP